MPLPCATDASTARTNSSRSVSSVTSTSISLDRKSTRLNSSHITISYAVFCLKKKKNNTDRRHVLTACNRVLYLTRLRSSAPASDDDCRGGRPLSSQLDRPRTRHTGSPVGVGA